MARCLRANAAQYEKKSALIDTAREGGCIECGSHEDLHFHHRDPRTKSFNIARARATHGIAAIKAEIEKCDVLCDEHHRRRHSA